MTTPNAAVDLPLPSPGVDEHERPLPLAGRPRRALARGSGGIAREGSSDTGQRGQGRDVEVRLDRVGELVEDRVERPAGRRAEERLERPAPLSSRP